MQANRSISVNPFRCRMWSLHDRMDDYLNEQSCAAEILSFIQHGQLIPALGRPVRGHPDFDVEIICGARRLFVARHLNTPLAVDVREMTDREAIIAMDLENRQRADISPYERGVSFVRWLRSGQFASQDDLAKSLNISPSVVSRLMKVGRLPAVILNAFPAPTDICETWASTLMDALENPVRRRATLREARRIGESNRPPAPHVYRRLLSASAEGRKPRSKVHDEIVNDRLGQPLFRIRQQRDTIALLLPVNKVSARTLESIRGCVADLLQVASAQATNSHRKTPTKHLENGFGALTAGAVTTEQ
jgi:ParB family chromosome partitioning protein